MASFRRPPDTKLEHVKNASMVWRCGDGLQGVVSNVLRNYVMAIKLICKTSTEPSLCFNFQLSSMTDLSDELDITTRRVSAQPIVQRKRTLHLSSPRLPSSPSQHQEEESVKAEQEIK